MAKIRLWSAHSCHDSPNTERPFWGWGFPPVASMSQGGRNNLLSVQLEQRVVEWHVSGTDCDAIHELISLFAKWIERKKHSCQCHEIILLPELVQIYCYTGCKLVFNFDLEGVWSHLHYSISDNFIYAGAGKHDKTMRLSTLLSWATHDKKGSY